MFASPKALTMSVNKPDRIIQIDLQNPERNAPWQFVPCVNCYDSHSQQQMTNIVMATPVHDPSDFQKKFFHVKLSDDGSSIFAQTPHQPNFMSANWQTAFANSCTNTQKAHSAYHASLQEKR